MANLNPDRFKNRITYCTCQKCGKKFPSRSNRRKYCDNCLTVPVCKECGREFYKDKLVLFENKYDYFCSKLCANKYNARIRSAEGECIVCGKHVGHRDCIGQGIECGCSKAHVHDVFESNQVPGKCVICGKEVDHRDRVGRCDSCSSLWYKMHNTNPKFIDKMKNNGNDNLRLNRRSGNAKFKFTNVIHATEENIAQWEDSIPQEYKDYNKKLNECIESLHEHWQSIEGETKVKLQLLEEQRKELEQIETHLKEKMAKYGTLRCDGSRFVPKGFNSPNQYFAIIDGELYFHPHFTRDIYKWNEFSKRYYNYLRDNAKDIEKSIFEDFPDARFIHFDSVSDLEQQLVELDIRYFTYIKYAKSSCGAKHNKLEGGDIDGAIPLVVGKSGSPLVNTCGTDISFSYDTGHGPARKMINDLNLKWKDDCILVFSYNKYKNDDEDILNEVYAYNSEYKAVHLYKLLNS